MSLICVKNYKEMLEYRKSINPKAIVCRDYHNCFEIQEAFCHRIEREQQDADWRRKNAEIEEDSSFLFLESKEIQDYLESYGVKYIGNFLFESTWDSRWNELSKEEAEQMTSREFATWLNYPLQLACVVLSGGVPLYVDEAAISALDVKYLKPVVEKKDLFCKIDYYNVDFIIEFIEAGCDVIIDHESVTERFKNGDRFELWSYCESLFPKYITRELDAKVLDGDMIKAFTPFTPRTMLLSELEKECSESEYHYFLEEHPELTKTVYIENAEPAFSAAVRRPPIYLLWLIDGEWYFLHINSFRYPTYIDLVLQAAFSPEEYSSIDDRSFDAASVEKVFALVLDVDEICDASKYWESIAFYLKYDRKENVIEICEKNPAIIEFHNLLQESKDLKDRSGGRMKR